MINALDFLTQTIRMGASDLFIVAGRQLSCKKDGRIETIGEERLMPADTAQLIRDIYSLADGRDLSRLQTRGDDDFSFAVSALSRFRASAYMQRASMAAVIRIITFGLPAPRNHPLGGVFRKRGRSAPSCAPAPRRRTFPLSAGRLFASRSAQGGRAGHISAREARALSSVFSGEIPPGAQCAPLRPVRGLPLRQTGEIPPQRRKPHFENLCPQAGGSFDRRPALL